MLLEKKERARSEDGIGESDGSPLLSQGTATPPAQSSPHVSEEEGVAQIVDCAGKAKRRQRFAIELRNQVSTAIGCTGNFVGQQEITFCNPSGVFHPFRSIPARPQKGVTLELTTAVQTRATR
jgi:hypothetical protein